MKVIYVSLALLLQFTLCVADPCKKDGKVDKFDVEEALKTSATKVFKSLWKPAEAHLPITIQYCTVQDPKHKCVHLRPHNESTCKALSLRFSGLERLSVPYCYSPSSKDKECRFKCYVDVNKLQVTHIFHTGQEFNHTSGFGYPVYVTVEVAPSRSSPIAAILDVHLGGSNDTEGFSYGFSPAKEKLPPPPCFEDIYSSFVNVAFHEKLLKQAFKQEYRRKVN